MQDFNLVMNYIFSAVFAIALISCTLEQTPVDYLEYQPELDSITRMYSDSSQVNSVDLSKLFDKKSWDSIEIILPYLPDQTLNGIDFPHRSIKDSMKAVTSVEWKTGLLFYKGKRMTGYSVVAGNPTFVNISGEGRPPIPVIKNSNCIFKLLSIIERNGATYSFVPVDYKFDADGVGAGYQSLPLDSLF